MYLIEKIVLFFDKLEDHVRIALSHKPIAYAFIGGVGIVLFWKGVWETAELFPILFGPVSIVLGVSILLLSGLLVSVFIGDSIILSGFNHEKKLAEKTENEVRAETYTLEHIAHAIGALDAKITKLEKKPSRKSLSQE